METSPATLSTGRGSDAMDFFDKRQPTTLRSKAVLGAETQEPLSQQQPVSLPRHKGYDA